jgi:hypothetical protein
VDEKLETANEIGRISLNRRTITRGIGWGVPAVMVLGATPAFAATGDAVAITNVTVFPAATGTITAPLVADRTINLATPATATVTVTGTATPGVDVRVTSGAYTSDAVTATGGNWSITIPAGIVSEWNDGSHTFTAIVVAGNKPSATTALTVVKDTVAPLPTITVAHNDKAKVLTISGTLGAANAASADIASGTVTGMVKNQTVNSTVTTSPWSFTVASVNKNEKYSLTIQQRDAAGNVGSAQANGWTGTP